MPKCLIVDDHEIVTGGLSFFLSTAKPDYDISKVGTVREARTAITSNSFDIYFFDVSLPDGTGVDLLTEVRTHQPDAQVIMYTGSATMLDLERLQDLGANAIISKGEPTDMILEGLDTIKNGGTFISPSIQEQLGLQTNGVSLTPRMRSVLALLAEGYGNKEIAARLNMAEPTVSFHLRGLRERLGVHNNRETLKRARDLKLL